LKLQQKAYWTRRKLRNPLLYAASQNRKKREAARKEDKIEKKNKTEDFHAFFQAIIPPIIYKKCG